jgi:hypothetical protein
MVRTIRLLLFWAAAGGVASGGYAQTTEQAPPPTKLPQEPEILRALPQIPSVPASLLQPAGPPMPAAPAADRPYFQVDPLLDPPELPAPGCFADVGVGIVTPHIKNHLRNFVEGPGGRTDLVTLPTAGLGWTASPLFLAGYRLPSGFGEFALGYRFLDASDSGTAAGLDGPAALRSRLDIQQVNLTYGSRELSLWPSCDLKGFVGLKYASVFFDSQAIEPLGVATAGSGVFLQRENNHYTGLGPHFGFEVARRWDAMGLALVGRLDLTSLVGRITQRYTEELTAPGAVLVSPASSSQAVPLLNAQIGFNWQPPSWRGVRFFLGYQYEHWWNVGRESSINTMGELDVQGILMQAAFNY